MRFPALRSFVLVFALVFSASAAFGYIPPVDKLLKLWNGAADRNAAVRVTGRRVQGATSVNYQVRAEGARLLVEEAGRPVTDPAVVGMWQLMLRPAAGMEFMKSQGLDLTATGLGRNQGRVAWTLGVLGEGKPGAQVWLDRQWLAPLVAAWPGGHRIEYQDYESQSRMLPKRIVYTSASVTRTYFIDSVK